ncbi:hypothetical protein ZTR_09539 [Talaromyces verruculosus]|nr:hypothetical protein ZTR_09539 [Talaromyces verruculosus]
MRGWNFSSLTPGDHISHFDSYAFSGFSNSYSLRRATNRPSDCGIAAHIAKWSGYAASPRIYGGQGQPLFSITAFHVYTEQETDVTFEYAMPDGSTCRHTARCNPQGSTVWNHQCGGATSVTWWIPETSPVKTCELGLLGVEFDCHPRPAPSTSFPQLPPLTATVTSPLASDLSASSGPMVVTTIAATSTSGWGMRSNSMGASSAPRWSSSPDVTCASLGLSCRPVSPITTSGVALRPNSTAALSDSCRLTSIAPESSVMNSAWSPTPIPLSSTTMVSGANVTAAGIGASGLAPKCINTWLTAACIDNTHASCYCPSPTMVTNIVECIQAWGVNTREVAIALSCLTGICVEYVDQNPAIPTAAPTLTMSVAVGLGLTGILPPGFETVVTGPSALHTIPRMAFTTITESDSTGTVSTAEVGLTLIPVILPTVSGSSHTSSSNQGNAAASGTIHETERNPSIYPTLMPVTAGTNSPVTVWPFHVAWVAGLWVFIVLV